MNFFSKPFVDTDPVSTQGEAFIFAGALGEYGDYVAEILLNALHACMKYRHKRVLHIAYTPQGSLTIAMTENTVPCKVPTLETLSMTMYTEADLRKVFEWLHEKSGICYSEGFRGNNPF